MQTFLSEPTFQESAQALDSKRLNKQLLEVRQIFTALSGGSKGWRNHPATRMWAGYEQALFSYASEVATECQRRGIATEKNWSAIVDIYIDNFEVKEFMSMPYWWLDSVIKDKILLSHRGNLYRKDPDFYADYIVDWLTLDKRPETIVCCMHGRQGDRCLYHWPTHLENS